MKKFKIYIKLIGLCLFTFVNSNYVLSQEVRNCIIISEVLTPKIIDDKTIELIMRNGSILKMGLNRSCPQLKFHQSFSYQALRGEMCVNRDGIITRSGETCMVSSITETE